VIDAANSFPADAVEVSDSPSSSPTSLHLVAGGEVFTVPTLISGESRTAVLAQGSSTVEVFGGVTGGRLDIRDSSSLVVSGGIIGSPFRQDVAIRGESTLEWLGGEAGSITVTDDATATFKSGFLENQLISSFRAVISFSGGSVDRVTGNAGSGSVVNMSGGIVRSKVDAYGDGRVTVDGGQVSGVISANENSTVTVRGGQISASLEALGEGSLVVIGSSFNRPYGAISVGSGSITGVLADATPINVTFVRSSTATIQLACPGVGFLAQSTLNLAADQDNYCKDWTGVSQPADDLSRAGLELVDLTIANLSGALLIDTDFTGADLSGADLIAADMTGAILTGAIYDESTLFPSGGTWNEPPWGLPGDAAPWELDMVPAPEPSRRVGRCWPWAHWASPGWRRYGGERRTLTRWLRPRGSGRPDSCGTRRATSAGSSSTNP
jgi:hypothetical protein